MSGTPLPHVAADQQGGLPPVCGTGETDKAAGCRLLPFRQSAERSGLSTRLVFTVNTICGGPRHISREGRFIAVAMICSKTLKTGCMGKVCQVALTQL